MFGHQQDHYEAKQDAEVQAVDNTPVDLSAVDPTAPPMGPIAVPDNTAPPITPAPGAGGVSLPAITPSDPAATTTPPTPPNTDELLDIKQQALQQLSPLVGHLDQTPEEKFRTTMMMIQAADNHSLIKEAYEAAQAIPDEKVRAQALLDVVNEINYFTHRDQQQP
jgi:hypothetical protein